MKNLYAYLSKFEDLKNEVQKSLDYIKWKDYIKKDSTVFLKPNFTYPYYKEGITTSPQLIKVLLDIFKDRADKVFLGESDGGNYSFTADESFKGHLMPQICKESGVELINLSKQASETVMASVNGKNVKVILPEILLQDIDSFISVPVLKVHAMTNVTLSIKNLWGCYPDTNRYLYHQNLAEKLVLITKMLCPKMAIVDGTFALDGHGPMYGEAKKINLVLASNNPVLMDSLGTQLMGLPLEKVEHILLAEKEGLGTTNLNSVNINTDWKNYKMRFELNKTLIDKLNTPVFKNEFIAKIAYKSPFSPFISNFVKFLRNSNEQEIANDMERYYK